MTGQDIYDGALRMIAEVGGGDSTDDYAERAPYLLAALCCECASADVAYREAHGLAAQTAFSGVYLELSEELPLSERFACAAECYLASMLLVDEDETLSDRLYARYSDSISAIADELPGICGGITERYPM